MRILITGGAGMLARALAAQLPERGHEVVTLDRRGLDVSDAAAIGEVVAGVRPDAAIHCAAYTNVDGSEAREDYARLINADSTRALAFACAQVGARLVYPSTDYVFDGSAQRPYRTDDVPRPINAYGRTKLAGERAAAEIDDHLVVRISWLYGPERGGFVRTVVERARRIAAGEPISLRVVADEIGRPTWSHTAAGGIAALLEAGAPAGIHHVTGAGDPVSRYDLAREALRLTELEHVPIEPVSAAEFGAPAPRPRWSVLDLAETEAIIGRLHDWRTDLEGAIRTGAF